MDSRLTFELGMCHLGRNNFSESALFKVIGNERWNQIQEAGGVPTSLIRDENGKRLYATFFFLELNFSRQRPLSAYSENDILDFSSDLSHYGRVYLDGRYRLAFDSSGWIRSSNVFIYPEQGPSKLAISSPANMDFTKINELEYEPDSLMLCRQAKSASTFLKPEPNDVEMFAGSREFVYEVDADRDLNGAGLIYFANFISFLDLAERKVLEGLGNPVPASILNNRSTYRRLIGYYGNARATDSLRILLRARMRLLNGKCDTRLIDFGFDYKVSRSSDDKEIVISSCRKVAPITKGSIEESWAMALRANS